MRTTSTLFGLLAAIAALPAMAQDNLEIIGKPIDGKMGFQPAQRGNQRGFSPRFWAFDRDYADRAVCCGTFALRGSPL